MKRRQRDAGAIPVMMTQLMLASWETIYRRSLMMAHGTCTALEYQRMVTEKTAAMQAASLALLTGRGNAADDGPLSQPRPRERSAAAPERLGRQPDWNNLAGKVARQNNEPGHTQAARSACECSRASLTRRWSGTAVSGAVAMLLTRRFGLPPQAIEAADAEGQRSDIH